MRFARRLFPTVVLFAVVAALIGVSFTPVAGASTADAETAFVRDINSLRASRGTGAMTVHPMLTVVARGFAKQMAARGEIFHNPGLAAQAPGDWRKLGENVGVGGTQASLHKAFVDSPNHLRNLLDAEYGYVGVGVFEDGGRMWVVEVFMRSDAPLPQVSPPRSAATDRAALATRYNLALRAVRR